MALGGNHLFYTQQQQQQQQQQYYSVLQYQQQSTCPQIKQMQQKQEQPKQLQVLRTRNVCQKPSKTNMPYMKRAISNNCDGTTLDSNNPAVIKRNARERNRVKQVNNGFFNLRQHIPNSIIAEVSKGRRGIGPGADKKLSKVDTLRMATEYIRRLKGLIDEVDNSDASSVSSYGGSSMYSSQSSSISYPTNNSQIHPAHRNTASNSSSSLSLSSGHYLNNPVSQSTFYSNPAQLNCSYQQQLISPVSSMHSYQSSSSIDSTYSEEIEPEREVNCANTTLGFLNHSLNHIFDTQRYDDMKESLSSVTDDEELLDYISLWQDE